MDSSLTSFNYQLIGHLVHTMSGLIVAARICGVNVVYSQ